MRLRRGTLVDPSMAIAVAGAALLLVQWVAARPLWLDEEFLAINLRDRGISNYLEPLWLGQTAPFGWLALERLAAVAFGTGERARASCRSCSASPPSGPRCGLAADG